MQRPVVQPIDAASPLSVVPLARRPQTADTRVKVTCAMLAAAEADLLQQPSRRSAMVSAGACTYCVSNPLQAHGGVPYVDFFPRRSPPSILSVSVMRPRPDQPHGGVGGASVHGSVSLHSSKSTSTIYRPPAKPPCVALQANGEDRRLGHADRSEHQRAERLFAHWCGGIRASRILGPPASGCQACSNVRAPACLDGAARNKTSTEARVQSG